MILLTGASGNTGGEVARMLSASGTPFRCMVRREEAKRELENRGYEVVLGDFDRRDTLEQAMVGVSSAYLVCTPDELLEEREGNFIAAAGAAGLPHIVKLSALLAARDADSPNLRSHARVEEQLLGSGIASTIIRPHAFMQTLYLMSQEMIEGQGMMVYPGGGGRLAAVDLRDVARAVAEALTGDHRGKILNVTGPVALSFSEMAETFSQALGKPVTYVECRDEDMLEAMVRLGISQNSREHVIAVFRLIREGALSLTTRDLEEDLGISPRSFRQFAEDLAAGKTAAATSFKAPAAGSSA